VPDDQGRLEEATALQILDQARDGLVGLSALLRFSPRKSWKV
jgi:hypothetical protein